MIQPVLAAQQRPTWPLNFLANLVGWTIQEAIQSANRHFYKTI